MSLFQIDAGREWRGGQRQVLFLARALKAQGRPFRLVCQPGSPLHDKAAAEGLPVLPLRMRSELDVRAVLKLARAMRREGCRLAHFHDAHAVAVGKAAAAIAKVPVRIISRRVDFPVKSLRKYVKAIDAVIAISDEVKRILIKGGVPARMVEVVPSGIDFSPFREAADRGFLRRELGFRPDDFLVGIVAQLEDHKGHRYLIDATRIIKEATPRVKLVVVGSGSLELELTRQAHELGVEDLVFFLGFRDDVPRILGSLDLFVLSSHMEGLGSSIMDAMAAKLPVVATRAGGIPEIVVHRETGLLVPARSPSALAEAVLKLYKDRKLAAALGEKGFRVVH
ncbi:MAG: glycosyltransferase, partial [Candidatus Aminicenantes bacterium]|nr:glycosyltransferase [Candidatus Aminicenantes bacterium]